MHRLALSLRQFARDPRGAVTIDWVAVTGAFVIVGIGIVYAIMGDDDSGLIGLVNDQQERASASVNDVDDLVSTVNSWSPDGS